MLTDNIEVIKKIILYIHNETGLDIRSIKLFVQSLLDSGYDAKFIVMNSSAVISALRDRYSGVKRTHLVGNKYVIYTNVELFKEALDKLSTKGGI